MIFILCCPEKAHVTENSVVNIQNLEVYHKSRTVKLNAVEIMSNSASSWFLMEF